jgi:hypothetical protein
LDDLTSSYDLIILSDTNRGLYRPDQLEWFKAGVEEAGLGLMMVGGVEAFGGKGHPSWGASSVEDALPVLSMADSTFETAFRVRSDRPDDSFVSSLPWHTMPFFKGMNVVNVKEGSRIILYADKPPNHPVLVYWEFGRGSGLAHTPDWTPSWGEAVMDNWDYYLDYVANMNFLNAGARVPQNLELVHNLRTRFHDYHSRWALAVSLMEFVEKFGANIAPIERRLFEIVGEEEEAERMYLMQEYEEAATMLEGSEEAFRDLSLAMTRLKERAMLWIYIVEWFVVTGTFLVCGTILWSLMVKRRLYREVKITRASEI